MASSDSDAEDTKISSEQVDAMLAVLLPSDSQKDCSACNQKVGTHVVPCDSAHAFCKDCLRSAWTDAAHDEIKCLTCEKHFSGLLNTEWRSTTAEADVGKAKINGGSLAQGEHSQGQPQHGNTVDEHSLDDILTDEHGEGDDDCSPAGDADEMESDDLAGVQAEGADEPTMKKRKTTQRKSRNTATTKTQGSRNASATRASTEEKKKRPARKKKEENSLADPDPTRDQDRKAPCKRTRSVAKINTTKAAAESDVVNGDQSNKKRQASVAPGRKYQFSRRRISDEALKAQFPWAGEKEPRTKQESQQISLDMLTLRNLKKKIKKREG